MLIAALLLLSLSITVIYTSPAEGPSLALAQAVFGLVGIGFFYLLRQLDLDSLARFIKPAYIFIVICLIITLIVGLETRGSVRWISIGPLNFQPSEFAKPIMILALAYFWSKNKPTWINIGKSLVVLLPIAALIFKQPDLGTTLTITFIWIAILVAANLSWAKMLLLSGVAAVTIPSSWFFLQDYQKQRIFSFLSPTTDATGIGFHVIQSMIAVGSGMLFGRGLGRGTQSRLQFLPEFRTDFIFAFISEELGFFGSSVVLLLYGIIFFYLFKLLARVESKFGELIIVGVMGMLFFQIVVNVGMNIGLLPITGITLPLLSYGGSSIITTLISLGLVSCVSRFGTRRQEVSSFGVI